MTVRELINQLMDLDLDKPIYITRLCEKGNTDKAIGFMGRNGYGDAIELSKYKIIDVNVCGVYQEYYNCITIQ